MAPSKPPSTAPGAGTEPSPDQLRYLAVLTDLQQLLPLLRRRQGQGVDVDLSFNLIAERGPALLGQAEEVTYFVATRGA